MVLSKQAEWAAVDSTTLLFSKKFMYDGGKDIITLETLGRLPPYPIVVNAKLSGECIFLLNKYLSTCCYRDTYTCKREITRYLRIRVLFHQTLAMAANAYYIII